MKPLILIADAETGQREGSRTSAGAGNLASASSRVAGGLATDTSTARSWLCQAEQLLRAHTLLTSVYSCCIARNTSTKHKHAHIHWYMRLPTYYVDLRSSKQRLQSSMPQSLDQLRQIEPLETHCTMVQFPHLEWCGCRSLVGLCPFGALPPGTPR